MSQIILHAEGMSIKLLDFEYLISKKADNNGYPYGGGTLKYVIASVEATKDITFFEYALSHTRFIPKIVFEIKPAILGRQKTRYITIYDAHIMRFQSHFCDYSPQPMTETFFITAQGMEQSHSKTIYSTPFRKTFESKVTPMTREDDEPRIVECYYTDLEGNKMVNPQTGDEIYAVLETENLVGKLIDWNLDDKKRDFLYQGNYLENDTMINFKVTANTLRVKLKVIAPQPNQTEIKQN